MTDSDLLVASKPERLAKLFWEKVDKNGPVQPHCPELGPCWVWTGKLDDRGYGRVAFSQKFAPRYLRSHRASWLIHNGPFPRTAFILHHCDNRACVRPDHLWTGTNADNMADCLRKGRFHFPPREGHVGPKGEAHPKAKLTEKQVEEIRNRRANNEGSLVKLASEYGVTAVSIGQIIRGKHWAHVGGPLTTDRSRGDSFVYEYDGKRLTLRQWAKLIGVNKATLVKRIKRGLPLDRVFESRLLSRYGFRRDQ